MAFGGSSTYSPGSSSTTVQTRPGGVDPTAAIMAMIAREKLAFDQGIAPPAAPAPAPKMAAPTAPVMSRPGPTSTDAARVLANRSAPAPAQIPTFRKLMGGANTMPGWVNVDEAEPGAAFAGWRISAPPGPTHIQDAPGIGNSLGPGMAPHPNAQFQQEQAAVDARNGGADERPDWFNTGRKKALSATEKPLTDPGARF